MGYIEREKMTNHFDSNGGEQNIVQGENAIGKQENTTQPVTGDGNIFSGTGNVTVNQNAPFKSLIVLLALVLAVAVFGGGLAAWYWIAPVLPPDKSTATVGPNSPAIITDTGNVSVTYTNSYDIPQKIAEDASSLSITDSSFGTFLNILKKQQITTTATPIKNGTLQQDAANMSKSARSR